MSLLRAVRHSLRCDDVEALGTLGRSRQASASLGKPPCGAGGSPSVQVARRKVEHFGLSARRDPDRLQPSHSGEDAGIARRGAAGSTQESERQVPGSVVPVQWRTFVLADAASAATLCGCILYRLGTGVGSLALEARGILGVGLWRCNTS